MRSVGKTVIGVDLGGTKVAAGRVRNGEIEHRVKHSVPAHEDRDTVLSVVSDAIAEVMTPEVGAIGCGVPSVVDVAEGIVREVGNIPSWKAVPLKAELERRFSIPAAIDNDANVFALGEFVFGAGKDHQHLVGITLGTGLGAGVIVDGRLLHGANCGVGELGKTARKGMRLEDWCASTYFPREWNASAGDLHRKARDGDPHALESFSHYGDELSEAIMLTLYVYDPQIIVLGGSISTAFDLFEPRMRAGLEAFAYPHIIERVLIEPSRLEHAAILGAAALAIQALRTTG
jgi:glucokinase